MLKTSGDDVSPINGSDTDENAVPENSKSVIDVPFRAVGKLRTRASAALISRSKMGCEIDVLLSTARQSDN